MLLWLLEVLCYPDIHPLDIEKYVPRYINQNLKYQLLNGLGLLELLEILSKLKE